ncbi:hypothetical protein HXX76_006751 [Chlamydomonas incerta]|uniref:Thaumatin-like protein n=1 Tax=Chlamydomonas incerta TaxID=51695 RepID=A0A835T086_CHLIN|nr:hypothetical protein HXX76_006751 [Chlamydomonas incerta]|eukprot:KAG2436448.1 hypothetical protein HXX76_006751 [Chlamydomonas incerta]
MHAPNTPASANASARGQRRARAAAAAQLALLLLCACPAAQAYIDVRNNCGFALTAFWRSGAGSTHNKRLLPGELVQVTFSGGVWVAGVIWGSRNASINNGHATQLEFTIGADVGGGKKQDFYDVNAYNTPVRVRPLNPPSVSGSWCGSPSCVIPSLATWCTGPNYRAGPDPACINKDGPGLVATPGTRAFKAKCPQDDATSMFACKWGTNYEVKFCP